MYNVHVSIIQYYIAFFIQQIIITNSNALRVWYVSAFVGSDLKFATALLAGHFIVLLPSALVWGIELCVQF